MKLIEFTGMSRSGNHPIIFWMMRNISNTENITTIEKDTVYVSDNCIFLNNISSRLKLDDQREIINRELLKKTYEWYILSYEDCHMGTSHSLDYDFEKKYKFSIVRDIRNLLASRLKRTDDVFKWRKQIDTHMRIYPSFFEHYISHKNWNNSIFYDKWLVDKNYRDSVCNIVNVNNLDYNKKVTENGCGSSFVGYNLDSVQNLLNRKNMYKIPDKYLKKIEELNL
jgi:hypothetical protein